MSETRLQVILAATVPDGGASAWDLMAAVRDGTERRLAEIYGPGDYKVVVMGA